VRNILVTGGAGFIGSNFVRFLLEREPGVRVVNLDALTYAGSLENLKDLSEPDRHVFIHGDIRSSETVAGVFRDHNIDTVVHLAAESHVDRSILDPSPFVQTNILGTFHLLEAARQAWGSGPAPLRSFRFLHVSTDEVFGSLGPDDPPFTESMPYAPNSPYAASKAAADHLVRAYVRTYGLPAIITNGSNNYGPFQFPEKLIPLMILNAVRGEGLPIYGDGQQIRDWIHVQDHCDGLWRALVDGRPGETYNFGGGRQHTNLGLAQQICSQLDRLLPDSPSSPHASLITLVADRPGHDRRYAMDITKAGVDLGWKPRHSLEEGLRMTVEWYLGHSEWIEAIRSRPSYREWLRENYEVRGVSA
jgi:dTDP-glucose 4,6-dehydratase